MEHNYTKNPAIKLWLEHINEPGSAEKEVQGLWESGLWTVFPANDLWMNVTKYKQGVTEPDNKVMKLVSYYAGWGTVDVLVVELKRDREDKSMKVFNRVARDLLDDHMGESTNPSNTTLFGAVGIGAYVVFYRKILPGGDLVAFHPQPLHWEIQAVTIQGYFDYFKQNIPKDLSSATTLPSTSSANQVASSSYGAAPGTAAPPSSVSQGAASANPTAVAAESSLPNSYYFVKDQKHYFKSGENVTPVAERPKNQWVYNEIGWKDTGREKLWRYWDGKDLSYS
jgi:hypothetical protein